jgi:hypothetical protein
MVLVDHGQKVGCLILRNVRGPPEDRLPALSNKLDPLRAITWWIADGQNDLRET